MVSAEVLRQAAAGQEGFRLNLYGDSQALELTTASNYTLVMPMMGLGAAACGDLQNKLERVTTAEDI